MVQSMPQEQQIPLIFPPSPTPSIELSTYNCNIIRKDQSPTNYSLYPPSPPDSNGAPSPIGCQYADIKMSNQTFNGQTDLFDAPKKDYQLLREHLQDLSFQKKHNLKPLPLESLFTDDWDVQDDIEPVISLALEQARKDVEQTCLTLNISSGTKYIIFIIIKTTFILILTIGYTFHFYLFIFFFRSTRMEPRTSTCMASIYNETIQNFT